MKHTPIFFDLLQVALIVLKLLNKISWSWFLVLSPLWLSLFILIVFLGILHHRNTTYYTKKTKPVEKDPHSNKVYEWLCTAYANYSAFIDEINEEL